MYAATDLIGDVLIALMAVGTLYTQEQSEVIPSWPLLCEKKMCYNCGKKKRKAQLTFEPQTSTWLLPNSLEAMECSLPTAM